MSDSVLTQKLELVDKITPSLTKIAKYAMGASESMGQLVTHVNKLNGISSTNKLSKIAQQANEVQDSIHGIGAEGAKSAGLMNKFASSIKTSLVSFAAPIVGIGIMGAMRGIVNATVPVEAALGELASLGVKDLNSISKAAEDFSNKWAGTSKAEFIASTYDVKSALSGLTDEAIGGFTKMAALTGKATKASTQEMVGAFTTAYGIFKPLMSEMDDMQWSEAFAGAMSKSVAIFKTTGSQMSDAIKNIGAVASASKVPLEEQMAILGQLQTTMKGSEAGTLYKAFMMKAAEAGNELGLSFINAQGQLKGVVPILEAIKDKFPDLSQAAAQVELKKAFGSDEAVKFILQMSSNMGGLEGNIKQVSQAMNEGSGVAKSMAVTMNNDLGARIKIVKQNFANLASSLGSALIPPIEAITTLLVGAVGAFRGLIDIVERGKYPLLGIGVILSAMMFKMDILTLKTYGSAIALKVQALAAGLSGAAIQLWGVLTAKASWTALGPIGLVIGSLWLLWETSETASEIMVRSWSWATDKMAQGISYVVDSVMLAIGAFKDLADIAMSADNPVDFLNKLTDGDSWGETKSAASSWGKVADQMGEEQDARTRRLVEKNAARFKDNDNEDKKFGMSLANSASEIKLSSMSMAKSAKMMSDTEKMMAANTMKMFGGMFKNNGMAGLGNIFNGWRSEMTKTGNKVGNWVDGGSKVEIDQESLETLKNIASFEIVNRFTTLNPTVQANFGDVRETVDINDVLEQVGKSAHALVATSLSP